MVSIVGGGSIGLGGGERGERRGEREREREREIVRSGRGSGEADGQWMDGCVSVENAVGALWNRCIFGPCPGCWMLRVVLSAKSQIAGRVENGIGDEDETGRRTWTTAIPNPNLKTARAI